MQESLSRLVISDKKKNLPSRMREFAHVHKEHIEERGLLSTAGLFARNTGITIPGCWAISKVFNSPGICGTPPSQITRSISSKKASIMSSGSPRIKGSSIPVKRNQFIMI